MSPFKLKKNLLMGRGKDKDDDGDKNKKKDQGISKGKGKLEAEPKQLEPSDKAPQDLEATEIFTCVHNGKKMMGTFAKHKIEQGTRIIMEEPLLSSYEGINHRKIYENFLNHNVGTKKVIRSLSHRSERVKYHQERVIKQYGMENLCKESGASESDAALILAIFDDNQIPLQHPSSIGKHVARKIARINHSCEPNVAISWNGARKCFVVHTLEEIDKGEEIRCSYIFLPEPREERQKALQAWNIECDCDACKLTTLSTFEQGQQFAEKDKKERPNQPKRRSTGEFNQFLLNDVKPEQLRLENRKRHFKKDLVSINDGSGKSRQGLLEEMISFLGTGTPTLAEEVAHL